MDILKPIYRAYDTAKAKKWDMIYWAIDLHGTMVKSTYKSEEEEFYPMVKECLKELSKSDKIKLILYTCSYEEHMEKLMDELRNEGIIFDYLNENPECKDTEYGTYKKKPYFNVLLEDKAGFEPSDWYIIWGWIQADLERCEKNLVEVEVKLEKCPKCGEENM